MSHHVVELNATFAIVQLVIAIGLFVPATMRIALAASVGWSLLVWWLGEGLGGVLAGPVSPLAGLPGAVILYAVIALLLWPTKPRPASGSPRPAPRLIAQGVLRRSGATVAWLLTWAMFAVEDLLPANRAPDGLRQQIDGMADGEPSWIADLNRSVAGALARHGSPASIILALLCAFIGASIVVPSLSRLGVLAAVAFALLIWIVGQDFGQIATGSATDPNSGPPLVLLALCYWPGPGWHATHVRPSFMRTAKQYWSHAMAGSVRSRDDR